MRDPGFTRPGRGGASVATLLAAAAMVCACGTSDLSTIAPPVSSSPAPDATASVPLPDSCDAVLTAADVGSAIGRPLAGVVEERAGADPVIGREERISCAYGSPVAGDAVVRISLSRYTDPQACATRVASTVTEEQAQGATARRVQVRSLDAMLLLGPTTRLLVSQRGDQTVAVSLEPGAVPDATTPTVLVDLVQGVIRDR